MPPLDGAVEICRGLARAPAVQLEYRKGAGRACVQGDPDRLSQVFINLISNAIKYNTAARPLVRVESAASDGWYEVFIVDNGPGIPEALRERLFSKFSRGWTQTASHRQGAGLGLAISRQIMVRLGGALDLMPAAPGQGACFRVRLPLAGLPAAAVAATGSATPC